VRLCARFVLSLLVVACLAACGTSWRVREADRLHLDEAPLAAIRPLVESGRGAEARAALDGMAAPIKRKPGWAYLSGRASLAQGNAAAAIHDLERARDGLAGSVLVENDLGAALVRAGRAREAVGLYARLAAAEPEDREIALNLATARYVAGETVEAQRGLARLAADRPDWFEARFNHGLAALANHDFALAADELRAALKLRAWNRDVLVALTAACALLKDDACADTAGKEAVSRYPDDASVRLNRGAWLEEKGDLQEAMNQYREAVIRDPRCANCWYDLGRLAERLGDGATAMEAYRQYVATAGPGMSTEDVRQRLRSMEAAGAPP